MFSKEANDFIQILLIDADDINAKIFKKEIFSPTREIKEQIASFTDKNHPLRKFFSVELLNALRRKNYSKSQQLLEKCENEESARIKCESEKTVSEQRNKFQKIAISEQIELEKKES